MSDNQPSPRPRPKNLHDRIDEQTRAKIRAYPGTITYLDLIRKNKRQSVLLIIAMILLAAAFGGIVGGSLGWYSGVGFDIQSEAMGYGLDLEAILPSVIIGVVVAMIVASVGATWSWFGGANAIMGMSHAKELTSELDPELFNVVDEMRIAAGMPMPRVFLIGDSALNAFATGRDPEHGIVAITTGLRSQLSRDELQGVIAHEMAHIRHLDIRFGMLMATMVGIVVFTCDAFLRTVWHGARWGGYGYSRHSGGRGGGGKGGAAIVLLIIGLLLAVIAPIFARIIQMAYSRQREFLADAGAVELTRNPEGLASALSKLAMDKEPLVDTANRGTAHMYIINPLRKMRKSGQSINSLFLSHPPTNDRIARLLALTR